MKKQPLKSTRGGKREGAGRKAAPTGARVNVSFTLPPHVKEFLDVVSTNDKPRSIVVESLITASAEFRAWQKSRQ